MSVHLAVSMAAPRVAHVRPRFRRDFHIAIICALPLEYDAVSLLIDEFWDGKDQQYGRVSGDTNTYRNGRIGMHNVVLMLLPNMGKVSVAGSAASLRASYVGVRLAFLVGICGGVPGVGEMILGDVVISDDLVQYDFGRQFPSAFVAKDTVQVHSGLPSKDVRSLISYFRTESGKRDLQDDAAENLIKLQDLAVAQRFETSYKSPGPTEDKLFEATYRHRHRDPFMCEFCCGESERFCEKAAATSCAELGCDKRRLILRRRLEVRQHGRLPTHGPKVFIGRIASADMVMKSAEHRDRFAEEYKVIAFEMEAAGIWDEVSSIVVKGVSDYADSHKSKSWQPFAAATAAAVTKSILNRYNFVENDGMIQDSELTLQSQSDLSGSDAENYEQNSIQPSNSLLTVSTVVHDNQWKALHDAIFNFRRTLTSEQCKTLQEIKRLPGMEWLLILTAQLDSRNRKRKGFSVASRFFYALKSIRDFSAIMETSSCPSGLPVLLWASVEVTIEVIFSTATHYDAVSRLFRDLGRLCPQTADYGSLYPASAPLQKSLIKIYALLILCCTDILRFVRYERFVGASKELSQFEFEPHMNEMRRYSDAFQKELRITRISTHQLAKPKENNTQKGSRLKGLLSKTGNNSRQSGAWQLRTDEQSARERRQQLLDFLSTHDHITKLKQSREKRHAGTAEWLFETKEFDQWANKTNSLFTVFWCSGKIGSGKTILVASLIDKLLTENVQENSHARAYVAFFLVMFDDEESTKADVIFRSILRQAINMAGLDDQMINMLEKWHNDLFSGTEDVVQMLCTISEKLRNFHIVIDGLDECEKKDRNALLSGFSTISSAVTDVRIFLCGRESISREVEKTFQARIVHLSMNCRPAQSDIPKYIESVVQARLQCEELIVDDQTLIDEIKSALTEGADGMFLWVSFQLDALCSSSQKCDDEIRQAIRDLPRTLTDTFERALRRIILRGNADMASRCFQWVAAAKRPLSIDELREAISVDIGQEYSERGRWPNNMKNISSFCENLVHVDEEKNIVQFAHHTVKQFLTHEISDPEFRAFHFKLEDVDHFIGEICVTYLNFNDFNTTLVRRPRQAQHIVLSDIARTVVGSERKSQNLFQTVARVTMGAGKKPKAVDLVGTLFSSRPQDNTMVTDELDHPFLKYASQNMIFHTRQFTQERSRTWNHWRKIIFRENDPLQFPWGSGPIRENDPVALKWCLRNSHVALIRVINRYGEESRSKEQNDSLCCAVEASNLTLVETLLASGSDPNALSNEDMSAIGIAARVGSLEVVDTLILAGAHVNTSKPDVIPALHLAAEYGNTDVVKRLIAEGAIVNFIFRDFSALGVAGERGQMKVVKTLLDAGADLMVDSYGISSMLHLAATSGDPGIMQEGVVVRYIAHKFDERLICSIIYTAVINRNPDIVHRILQIRFNLTDPGRPTADAMLWLAAAGGHLGVLKSALSRRPDVNAPLFGRRIFKTPLQKAAELERPDLVDALLLAGSHMDRFEHGPEIILHLAIQHGSLKILEKALDAGAGTNSVLDKDEGYTALHIAARLAALEVLKGTIIFMAGADENYVEPRMNDLWAAREFLERLIMERNVFHPSKDWPVAQEVLGRLREEQKHRSQVGPDHDNKYYLATDKDFVDIIYRLLIAGAHLHGSTYRGQTPLHIAVMQWDSFSGYVGTGWNKTRLMENQGRRALISALGGIPSHENFGSQI